MKALNNKVIKLPIKGNKEGVIAERWRFVKCVDSAEGRCSGRHVYRGL